MAMARVLFVALALLRVIVQFWLRILGFYVGMHKFVHSRVQQLSSYVAQLLRSMAQGSQERQEQSGVGRGAPLFAALQHWQLWAFAGLLVLFVGLGFWLRNKRCKPGSGNEEESSPGKEEDKEVEEESESCDEECPPGTVWAHGTRWPAAHMAENCRVVEELVDNLLRACRGSSCHSFKPQLQPALGVACVDEGCSAREDNVLYRLLVPLRPPPGHAFHVELGDEEETRAKTSCVRVELECTCARERLLGDMLCFVHHAQEQLREKQEPSLLDTFCEGSYLHVEKTTLWFQNQVKAAWRRLPLSRHCRLTLLPSQRSCKLKLTTPSKRTLSVEMLLGLQLDDSGTFLNLE